MNQSSTESNKRINQRHKGKWLAVFGVFALSVLLIGNSNPFAAQTKAQAGRLVEIEQGKRARSSFALGNHCPEPHRLRVTSNVKFLHFEQPADAILIGPASNLQIGVVFDTTGLEIRVHQGKLIVECLDCDKQARKCMQSPLELPFELSIIRPVNQLPGVPADDNCATKCSPLKVYSWHPCTCIDSDGDT